MLLIQIIFYSYILRISNQYVFNFSNITDFCSELSTMTIDGVVYLTHFVINKSDINTTFQINNTTSILELYNEIWKNKKSFLTKIYNYQSININFTNLISEFNNLKVKNTSDYIENYKKFIKGQPREYKIRWVINMENYQINEGNIKAKFGGIVDYVNFKSNEFLEEMLLNSVKDYNMSFDLFEEKIIGLRKEYSNVRMYIVNKSRKNYLKQLFCRVYTLKIGKGGNDFNYNRIDEYLKNNDLSFLRINLINIIDKEMLDLTNIDVFIDKIEYSGHRFIDYNEKLNDFNEEKLKTIALYSESVHKIVFNETKSLSYLDYYINNIPIDNITNYIKKTIKEIPELNDFSRFNYIENIEREDIIRNIISLIDKLPHDAILRMMINLNNLDTDTINNDDELMENIFFYSNQEIKDFFIYKIKEYSYLKEYEMFLFKAEPNSFYNEMFYKYRKKFPEYTLKEILTALNEYYYNKSLTNKFEDIKYMKKKDLLENIETILNTQPELKEFKTFYQNTNHIKGMNCYANFADFVTVHSNEELRRWIYKLQNYVKKKNNYENIYYRLDFDINIQQQCIFENEKDNLVNIIYLYQELYPELRDYSFFINIIGKTKFQNKILNLSNDEIRNYAYKLYQYYGIKSYKIKPYTEHFFENNSFINYINETNDIDSLRLFINRVVVVYPELQIDGILKEVLNSKNFSDTMSEETDLNSFLEFYNNQSIKTILYSLLRYSNATNNKEFFIPEDQNITILKVEFKKIFFQNKFLHSNWNFARLINGNNDLLYGGLLPLLTRLNEDQLKVIAKYFYNKLDFIEFNYYPNDLKILVLIDVLNDEEISKEELFEDILEFKKLLSIDLSEVPKYKLIQYALICEYYVREKNETSKYGSIYNNLYTITREEIEDYINSTYFLLPSDIKSEQDFNRYSHYLEFDKKEINTDMYSY